MPKAALAWPRPTRQTRQKGRLNFLYPPDANARDATTISAPASRVLVAVEPTNEEWMAAHDALALLSATPPPGGNDESANGST